MAATNGPLERVGKKEETYRTASGKTFHLRTSTAHGTEPVTYWFGMPWTKWQEGEFFVLSCGNEADLVLPVGELLPYRDDFPRDKGDRAHLHVARSHYYVITDVNLVVNEWVNAFHLLA